jgi:hypothetical protein
MGVVYLATQEGLGRPIALKMISQSYLPTPEELEALLAEARLLASLRHPNIVTVHYVGAVDGKPFFCMEYLANGSLATELERRRQQGEWPAPKQAAQWLVLLARTMQYVHEQGIMHRDLKPGNILLGDDHLLKIGDFGLARPLKREGELPMSAGLGRGTPSYMAPEQAFGVVKGAGSPADVYGLGAILYELLTGRPPFVGSERDVLLQIADRNVHPIAPRCVRPNVPRDLEQICLKSLARDQRDRYEAAGELADDLQRFLDGKPVRARPVPVPVLVGKWVQRNRWPFAALVLLAVLAVGGMAAAFYLASVQAETQREKQDKENALVAEEAARLKADNLATKLGQALAKEKAARQSEARENRRARLLTGQLYSVLFLQDEQADPGETPPASLAELAETLDHLHKECLAVAEGPEEIEVTLGIIRATLARVRGQSQEELAGLRRAIALAKRFLQTRKDRPEFKRILVNLYRQLGDRLFRTKSVAEAWRMLRQSTTLAEAYLADDPADARLRLELVRGYLRLGDEGHRRGQPAAVVRQHYEQALEHARTSRLAKPADAVAREEFIHACQKLAAHCFLHYSSAKAIPYDELALEVAQEPPPPGADPRPFRLTLWRTYTKYLADYRNPVSRDPALWKRVEKHAASAIDLARSLDAECRRPETRWNLWRTYINWGNFYQDKRDLPQVVKIYQKAIDHAGMLVEEIGLPTGQLYWDLCEAHAVLAAALLAQKKTASGRLRLRQAEELVEMPVQGSSNPYARAGKVCVLFRICYAYSQLDDWETCLRYADRAHTLLMQLKREGAFQDLTRLRAEIEQAEQKLPAIRQGCRRAIALRPLWPLSDEQWNKMSVAELAAHAEKIRQVDAKHNPLLLIAAGLHAECVKRVKGARPLDALSPQERKERAVHVARALALLQEAVDNQFRDVASLQRNSAFAPLRGESAFANLIGEMERKRARPLVAH